VKRLIREKPAASASPPTPDITSLGTRRSAFSLVDQTPSNSSRSGPYPPKSDVLDELEPLAPQEWTTPEMKLVPFQEPPKPHQHVTTSTFSILPSLQFFPIPRPLRTTLSLFGSEHFQVSDTTPSELDLALCVFPFLRYHSQTSQELTWFIQPPCCANAIEAIWDSSPRFQARCYTTWGPLEHHRPSILRPRFGWARDAFLCRCRILTHHGPAAHEIRSAGMGTNRRS